MQIIIVGCGRLGAELAYRLYKRGQDVAVIDHTPISFANLPPDFQGRICEGEALHRDVLHRGGIETAGALTAVTSSDAMNMCVGHIARTIYHIPNVVVRNFNPQYLPLYKIFDLQVISSTMWGAQRVETMLFHSEARPVFSAGNGEVEVYEVNIPASCDGLKLKELLTNQECVPVALTRAGKAFLPTADTPLEVEDVLHISASFAGIETIRNRLCCK